MLVLINAFVGGMVGMERSIFPDFAQEVFGLASHSAILSFIIAFGISKAVMNYFTGRFANHFGRKKLLLAGWILVLPVPLILVFAGSWIWVVFANVLLGLSQGLTWSSTVVMKIDLVGEKNRGFAMGLNEFAGYLAVGLTALLSASLASRFGIRPIPFFVMEGIAVVGLSLSFFTNDTRKFVKQESKISTKEEEKQVFWNTSLFDKSLSSITQAGLVNNLNDGMMWGLLPAFLMNRGFELKEIGLVASIYPIVWGIGQLFTGKLGDHLSHKALLFWGMFLQAIAVFGLFLAYSATSFTLISVVLGLGTAMVYPTFMTAIAALSHPIQRAESLGVFRFWRDLGYAFGAIISGVIADWLGIEFAILGVAMITLVSSLILKFRMPSS